MQRAAIVSVLILLISAPAFAANCPDDDAACWIEVLKGDSVKDSLQACMALGNLKSELAIDPLILKLAHKDKYLATAAAYGLSKIGQPAVPALVEASTHKSANVRKYAAHTLGQIGGDVFSALSALSRDDDPTVRLRAIKALTLQKDKRAVTPASAGLQDQHRDIRVASAHLLAVLAVPEGVNGLLKYGMSDLSAEVSLESAAALIRIGSPAVGPMVERYEREADFVKTRYLYVFGEIARTDESDAGKRAAKMLFHVIDDPQAGIVPKQAAVTKLGDLGGAEAVKALTALKARAEGKAEYKDLLDITVRTLEKLNKR
jgi:HEAT repeat protein